MVIGGVCLEVLRVRRGSSRGFEIRLPQCQGICAGLIMVSRVRFPFSSLLVNLAALSSNFQHRSVNSSCL
jgi:3-methyladenine DNA glycosylase AlkC